MSCAPPPPPPPALAIPTFTTKSSNKDDRSMLLESIRKGTKLKKAVTNDKSAPLISGNYFKIIFFTKFLTSFFKTVI